MTTFAQFNREIREIENRLAYGSETSLYGHFVQQMFGVGGKDWRESDAVVPQRLIEWWSKAYELYAADQLLPLGEQIRDVQDIFNRL